MTYSKNVWKDQDVQRPRTYEVINNQDGSITLNDSFGVVTEIGTPVNATNMNHIEDGIQANDVAISAINDKIPSSASSSNKMAVASDITAVYTALTLKADKTQLHALKGYLDNGEVLTDAEGLADVKTYAHSTYDNSKFTTLIHGTPTITADGLMYGNGDNNVGSGLNMDTTLIVPNKKNVISLRYTYQKANVSGHTQALFFARFDNTSNSFLLSASEDNKFSTTVNGTNIGAFYTITENQTYDISIVSDFKTYFKIYIDGVEEYSDTTLSLALTACSMFRIGNNQSWQTTRYNVGAIDLKYLEVTNDNIPVFSGNKTGIDTYTIGGNTVSVPYTLSKTGSKIVNSVYRTQVTAVYNEYGYAPYYTLDEANGNFTLPQGEIYGMIRKAGNDYSKPNYSSGVSITPPFTATSGGWIQPKLEYFYGGATLDCNVNNNLVFRYVDNGDVDKGTAITPPPIPIQIGDVFSVSASSFQVDTIVSYIFFKNQGE